MTVSSYNMEYPESISNLDDMGNKDRIIVMG